MGRFGLLLFVLGVLITGGGFDADMPSQIPLGIIVSLAGMVIAYVDYKKRNR